MRVHKAEMGPMGGLPVLDEAGGIMPGDRIEAWGRVYEVIENPTGDDLAKLARGAGVDPGAVCFTIIGHGRDFAYHKPYYWAVAKVNYRATYFKTEGHL